MGDAFSTIPYDKGFQYLHYMETLFKTSADFLDLVQKWIGSNKFKSIDYLDFKENVEGWLDTNYDGEERTNIEKLLRWDDWVLGTGLPPVPLHIQSDAADAANQLAQDWVDGEGKHPENWQE